jgi:hypothetical protein
MGVNGIGKEKSLLSPFFERKRFTGKNDIGLQIVTSVDYPNSIRRLT